MGKPIIAGNWKMNGSQVSITQLLTEMLSSNSNQKAWESSEIIVFPPSVYLSHAKDLLKGVNWYVGAQNLSNFEQGAYTGETAASMLRDVGCSHVLVGHSERRHIIGESNELVAQKYSMALAHKLLPILCIGETLEEREAGMTESIIAKQLKSVLDLPNGAKALSKGIIAYEPVWAIGTGLSAKAKDANATHGYIRNWFSKNSVDERTPIIYGGSVTPDNASEIASSSDIDGVLVGGASLDAKKFLEIIRCIS